LAVYTSVLTMYPSVSNYGNPCNSVTFPVSMYVDS
jgi:hypothetical protein